MPERPTALLRSAAFQGHDTGGHVENPRRLAAIEAELTRLDLLTGRPEVAFEPAPLEALVRVHDPRYLEIVADVAAQGGAWLDGDTVVLPDSWDVARLAAGAALAATDAVLDNRVSRAFCLVRPPGHHATPTRGMGFCLVNNVAVAAAHALSRGLERVAIVDWDVHHGNGTQDAFYATDRVFFCSLHQSPLYPGTGMADEGGEGKGEGYTLNLPLRPGGDDHTYRRVFAEQVEPALRVYRPELILVSAGFDAHARDPLANMRLSEAGFAWLASRILALATELCAGRFVALLEGGYDLDALAASVAATIRAFDGETVG